LLRYGSIKRSKAYIADEYTSDTCLRAFTARAGAQSIFCFVTAKVEKSNAADATQVNQGVKKLVVPHASAISDTDLAAVRTVLVGRDRLIVVCPPLWRKGLGAVWGQCASGLDDELSGQTDTCE